MVDDLGLSFDSIARIRQSLQKWVDQQMQPGDLVAVIRTGAGMGALQQFTGDKRMLYAAIDRVKFNGLGRVGISSFAPMAPPDAIDTMADHERERDLFRRHHGRHPLRGRRDCTSCPAARAWCCSART